MGSRPGSGRQPEGSGMADWHVENGHQGSRRDNHLRVGREQEVHPRKIHNQARRQGHRIWDTDIRRRQRGRWDSFVGLPVRWGVWRRQLDTGRQDLEGGFRRRDGRWQEVECDRHLRSRRCEYVHLAINPADRQRSTDSGRQANQGHETEGLISSGWQRGPEANHTGNYSSRNKYRERRSWELENELRSLRSRWRY